MIDSNLSVLSSRENESYFELEVYKDDDNDERGFIKTLVDGDLEEQRVCFQEDLLIPLKNRWRKRLITPNVFIIDHWRMIQDEESITAYILTLSFFSFKFQINSAMLSSEAN